MFRKNLSKASLFGEKDFQWRGGEVSRLESLMDAVFAIAVTLLIVSRDVPSNFQEFTDVMWGFAGFAVTFIFLFWIWYAHFIFHRRYGLEDKYTIFLNSVLIFVILFYIYPLKFLATVLISGMLTNLFGISFVGGFDGYIDMRILTIVYSVGFFMISLVLSLLYMHAYSKRELLELNEIELEKTVVSYQSFVIITLFALTSILLGYFNFGPIAGFIYFFIGPVIFLHFWLKEKITKT
ncbi:TMEM175 family protein [Aureispira]|nr:TMEM175 family protein [Aureispira sp.]